MNVKRSSLAGGSVRLAMSTAAACLVAAAVAAQAAPASDDAAADGRGTNAAIAAADTRPVTGKVALFIDETFAVWVRGVGGCRAVADVVTNSSERGVDKSLGATGSEPCVIQHGRGRSVFESYLMVQLSGEASRHDFTVVAFAGFDNRPVAAVRLRSALLSDFATPKLEASKEGMLLFESTLTANSVRPIPTTGFVLPSVTLPKPLLVSNFRVRLDGATVRPSTLGPLAMTRDVSGEKPGPWLVEDLSVATLRQYGSPFQKWYLQSVVDARPSELDLSIDLFEANQTTLGATVSLTGVGIFGADAGMTDARSFDLYVERAAFTFTR